MVLAEAAYISSSTTAGRLSGEINGKVTSGCLRSDSSVIQGKVSS